MKLNAMMQDVDAVNDGAWVGKKYGTPIPGFGDLCLKVRGTDSRKYRLVVAVKRKALTQGDYTDEGDIKDEVAERNFIEAVDEALLLDWDHLEDDHGGLMKHTPELQTKILNDPGSTPFRSAVIVAANMVSARRLYNEKAIEKN